MIRFDDLPIKQKIVLVMMLTCFSALIVAGSGFFAFQINHYQNELQSEMLSIARLVAANSQAAIEFDDHKAAAKILSTLQEDRRINKAVLYDENKTAFAVYTRPGYSNMADTDFGSLTIKSPIYLDRRQIGSISLDVDALTGLQKSLWEYAQMALITVLLAGGAAYMVSRLLQRLISTPIIQLIDTARKVSVEKDYTLRADKTAQDEIGILVDSFNEMLEQIRREDSQKRKVEEKLRILNEELERRVAERTEELKQSLEKLRRSERLASIGTLAAGMAHEIRNPINSISLAAQHALRYQKELGANQRKALEAIFQEATRCGTIVKNILLFAKSERTTKTPRNVNDIVHRAVILAKSYSHSKQAEIITRLDPEPGLVPVNPTEIEQVMINIINNAIETSAEDLQIVITTKSYKDRFEVTISDNGPGIEQSALNQIFDPFFSTKRKQGNTGLGISLCHGIISEHQGYLNAHSVVGEGTTFTIELPRELT